MKSLAVRITLELTVLLFVLLLVAATYGNVLPGGLPVWQSAWMSALLGGVLAGLWLHLRVSGPLAKLRDALSLAGAGDRTMKYSGQARDEIGQTGQAFNRMQEQLLISETHMRAVLEYQILHDALTGLPNRTLLMDRLEQAILAARRDHRHFSLMITDLDHFKEINDALGHHCGDIILQQAAERMKAVIRGSDTVARLGGDEFAFLLPTADSHQALRIASKVLPELERPYEIEDRRFTLGASIGVSMFPEDGDDSATLMRRADLAMYAAKRDNRGAVLYSDDLDRDSLQYLSLKNELRAAIDNDQLVLCYQPVIDLQSGRITGVEALARWRHPTRGMLYPDDFIPLAERTGLIRPLTLWVMKTAAQHGQAWSRLGIELRIAVNLSVHNLHDTELPQTIDTILGSGRAQPLPLRLEITETAIMPGPSHALDVLNRLSARGVRISIDDFGTGYSSLAYLKQLPVDEIKIDKSFVTGMVHDSDDAVIVRSTIDLAHNIGLRVVAEGVEDQATFDLLAGMHCDAVQGYYVSRPIEAGELLEWLEGSAWGLRAQA